MLDYDNNIMTLDNSSSASMVTAASETGVSISGITQVSAVKGIYTYDTISLIGS